MEFALDFKEERTAIENVLRRNIEVTLIFFTVLSNNIWPQEDIIELTKKILTKTIMPDEYA